MPRSPPAVYAPTIPQVAVSFDLEAFDNLVRNHGVRFKHYRAMRCPIGMTDMYDIRRAHESHPGCSNGFIYEYVGDVTCTFLSNNDKNRQVAEGQIDGSDVQVSAPRFYDNKPDEPVHVVPFDRFYLDDSNILVVNWQLFEHNVSGIDKLKYPVVMVETLVDANGRKYRIGDFDIQDGRLVWNGDRPGFDPTAMKGVVCSVRYRYQPYWYVNRMIHEVRVAQVNDPITGERRPFRTGQLFSLQREYIFENQQADLESPDADPRSIRAPGDVTFGAR